MNVFSIIWLLKNKESTNMEREQHIKNRHIFPSPTRMCLYGSIVVLVYIVTCCLVLLYQDRLVYSPTYEIPLTPWNLRLSYKDISLNLMDGPRIAGWFVNAKNPKGVILFCHGEYGNMSRWLESLKTYHDLGYSTLIFDYPGYGQSPGKPTEDKTYTSAMAAWNYLVSQRGYDPGQIIVCGRGLGGAVAAWLAEQKPCKALILESTFTSMKDVFSEIFSFLPVAWLCHFSYDTKAHLKNIHCPVLIVHSTQDDLIGFHHGKALYEQASRPKSFLPITGTHSMGFVTCRAAYLRGLEAFLKNADASKTGA